MNFLWVETIPTVICLGLRGSGSLHSIPQVLSCKKEREERGKAPPANPQDREHGCRAAGYEEEEDGAPKNPKNRFSSATGTG